MILSCCDLPRNNWDILFRGLTEQGLYRVGGVLSKVKKLFELGLDPKPGDIQLELHDPKQWESKTIASAVKQYFRDLSKPLLTYNLYGEFLEAVKHESEVMRVQVNTPFSPRYPFL